MRRIVSSALFLSLLATLAPPAVSLAADPPPAAAHKVPLDYKAYDGWNLIRGTKLSDDGNWIAYGLLPEDGDPTLVVRNLNTGAEFREERGTTPAFTPDSKFVVYTIRAKNDDIHKAEREHKTAAEQPKSGLGILDLVTGKSTAFERVKSVKLPRDAGSTTIAFLFEAPAATPRPSATPATAAPAATPEPTFSPVVRRTPLIVGSPGPNTRLPLSEATAASAPAPSPSASPSPDDLHKVDEGTELAVRDLPSAKQVSIKNVTEYAIAHDGAYVAYATGSAKDTRLDGFHVRATADGKIADVFASPGHYKDVAFAPRAELLAFLSDEGSFAEKAPHYDLYEIDVGHAWPTTGAAMEVAGPSTAGMPRGYAPSVNATPSYSKDGHRLFFGTAPAPTPVPSGTPEPLKVDVWSWNDGDLQPYQKVNADKERKRTYSALVADGRFMQLASPSMRNLTTTENPDFALGTNDLPYRKMLSWEGEEYVDQYAVSLHDGGRRLLARKTADPGRLSPDGRFLVGYDRIKRDWYSVDMRSGKRLALTANLKVAFYDEQDDHPAPPPPYGFGGWAQGGRFALLLDRYDVWIAEVASGKTWMLTQGEGRKAHVRLTPAGYDGDRDSYDPAKPIPLLAFNDDNKDGGLYVARIDGPAAHLVSKVVMLHKYVASYQKARNAERIVVSEQRFDEPLDLWSAPSLESARLAKISDADPQKSKYLWGSAQLISYKSTWGTPLNGILLLPENFERKKKYPMLVYFYERFADSLHHPPFSIPSPGTSPDLLRYVSNGYVVMLPDVAYRNGHPGQSALGCILPAIDAVTKGGFVDEKRIGIAGHSWAAYQIVYMLTQTHRFAAAEAGAAVADMISAYGGIRWESGLVREFQYEHSQSRIGATPWDRPDLYLENAALFHIKSITTPYLTIANDADGAVPWYQGIEFITAMRRLEKPAWMFEFDGEDHNLRGRENQKYWTVHLDEFFDHYLKDAPEPAWMRSGVPYVRRGEREIRTLYGEKP